MSRANGGAIVGEEYFPLDHTDYSKTVDKIMSTGAEVVFNTIVPPGLAPFLEQLYNSGFTKRGGHLVCTYFEENFLNLLPAAHVEGLYSCLDYYQNVSDPFSKELLNQYDKLYPGSAKFTGWQCVFGPVPWSEALGGCRKRGRLAKARRCHQGTGPRKDR